MNSNELRKDIFTEHHAMDRFRGNYAIDATERNPFWIMQPGCARGLLDRDDARYQLLIGDQQQLMVYSLDDVLNDLVEEQAQADVTDAFAVADNAIGSFREADLVIEVWCRSPEAFPVEFYLLT